MVNYVIRHFIMIVNQFNIPFKIHQHLQERGKNQQVDSHLSEDKRKEIYITFLVNLTEN